MHTATLDNSFQPGLKKMVLQGYLGKKYGREFELDISSPAEGIRALIMQLPGIREDIRNGDFIVVNRSRHNHNIQLDLGENLDLLHLGMGRLDEVVLTPVPKGSKSKAFGIGKIVAGVLLIGAALAFAPAGAGFLGLALGETAFTVFGGAITYGAIAGIGLAMVLGGVASLLTPQVKTADYKEPDNNTSFVFNGAANVTIEGVAVPLVYGKTMVGSVQISIGLVAEEMDE